MDVFIQKWILFHIKSFGAMRKSFEYQESVLQIIFYAFAQRIINGGGRVQREVAINDDAVDIKISWYYKTKDDKIGTQIELIELKTYRKSNTAGLKSFTESAKHQITTKYLKPMQLDHGYIIIWDQKNEVSVKEELYKIEPELSNGCRLEIITIRDPKRVSEKQKSKIKIED